MKIIVGIVTLMLIVLTGGAYLLFRNKDKKMSDIEQVRETASKVYNKTVATFRGTGTRVASVFQRKSPETAAA